MVYLEDGLLIHNMDLDDGEKKLLKTFFSIRAAYNLSWSYHPRGKRIYTSRWRYHKL